MRVASPLLLVAAILVSPSSSNAQDPATGAEALLLEREAKAKKLEPPTPNRVERTLMDLESGRLFERLLNPAEGLYPKLGNITSGSGFSLGPGYRLPACSTAREFQHVCRGLGEAVLE